MSNSGSNRGDYPNTRSRALRNSRLANPSEASASASTPGPITRSRSRLEPATPSTASVVESEGGEPSLFPSPTPPPALGPGHYGPMFSPTTGRRREPTPLAPEVYINAPYGIGPDEPVDEAGYEPDSESGSEPGSEFDAGGPTIPNGPPTLSNFLLHHLQPLVPPHPSFPAETATCPICYETFDCNHVPILITGYATCQGHIFGYQCLRQCIDAKMPNSNKCTLCRTVWFGVSADMRMAALRTDMVNMMAELTNAMAWAQADDEQATMIVRTYARVMGGWIFAAFIHYVSTMAVGGVVRDIINIMYLVVVHVCVGILVALCEKMLAAWWYG